ncbi:MAG: DNA polymerase III subunit beta [Chloroflexota bacterium]
MKVTCPQESLSKGLATVGRAVAARSTMPILSNILLATDGTRLRLSATNLEISINCWVQAEIEQEGRITVPARLLTDFVNSLPSAPVDMALNPTNRVVNMKCLRTEGNLRGVSADEFPAVPTVQAGVVMRQQGQALKEMINQVAIAAATDDSRPIFTGVLTTFRGTDVTMVAADGFRLGLRSTELAEGAPEELVIIIPARSLLELARILPDGKGQDEFVEIAVTPNKNQVIFRTATVELVSRLLEGQFPNYKQIMPKEWKTQAVVATSALLNATKTASFFARESANIVRLKFDASEVTVSATSSDLGDNESVIDAVVEGDPAEIAFNARYLADALSVLDSEQVRVELLNPSAPGVIKPVDSTDYVHVIMPMATAH